MGKNLVFLIVALMHVVSARAQELKLGFVDERVILEKLPARAEVQKILDQETALWEQRFTSRRQLLETSLDSVKTVQTELEKARGDQAKAAEPEALSSSPDSTADSTADSSAQTDSSGSPAKAEDIGKTGAAPDTLELLAELDRLERKLEKSKKEIVALYHSIYGRNGVLDRRNAELSQSILEKISRSISDVSQAAEVALIFDSSALLYLDQDINYTEQVMEALNIEQSGAR